MVSVREQMVCAIVLVSRDVIADSIETNAALNIMMRLIAIPGCDKNMPGSYGDGKIEPSFYHVVWRHHCAGSL